MKLTFFSLRYAMLNIDGGHSSMPISQWLLKEKFSSFLLFFKCKSFLGDRCSEKMLNFFESPTPHRLHHRDTFLVQISTPITSN